MIRNPRSTAFLFVAALTLVVTANAQPATAPLERAAVKAQTRSAVKSGSLTPAGQGPQFGVPKTSDKTREQRKSETLAARKGGQLVPAGDSSGVRVDRDIRSRPTTVDRTARKAETRAAEKAGKLVPAGEGTRMP